MTLLGGQFRTHQLSIVFRFTQSLIGLSIAFYSFRMDEADDSEEMKGMASSSTRDQYSHISCLLRALHQPIVNVSRPEIKSEITQSNGISENGQETASVMVESSKHKGKLPVIFDIETASDSSNPSSPINSSTDLNINEEAVTEMAVECLKKVPSDRDLQKNLELFNKNVINVMDTLIKTQAELPMHSLTPSPSASGRPFTFYHRMHRHSSAHSLNIPSIVVTGSPGDDQSGAHHHTHKRFTFGLRRHSHAHVVGEYDSYKYFPVSNAYPSFAWQRK